MSRCESFQEEIEMELAIGDAGQDSLSAECREHLAECKECTSYLEQELELNRALAEPVPLPPPDLADLVMARVAAEKEQVAEPSLPWGERLAWAASGAAAMFCLNNLPALSADWMSKLQMSLVSLDPSSFQVPYSLSVASVGALAVLLMAVQGVMVYQVRVSRS